MVLKNCLIDGTKKGCFFFFFFFFGLVFFQFQIKFQDQITKKTK